MITIPSELDLGRDQTRMKDGQDAVRQTATVVELLQRMYSEAPQGKPSQLQLVADEVGMGKTFVALGLAYSVLSALRDGTLPRDFEGCAPQVLVIAPQNSALVEKWKREIGEFVRRCIARENRDYASELFSLKVADRTDELVEALRRPESGIVITHMGVLSGGKKLLHYDLKRRVLLGALFRFWGNRLGHEERARLLKGAPEGWPSKADELGQISDDDWQRLPFADEAELLSWLRVLKARGPGKGNEELDALLADCREIAQPFTRDRLTRFAKIEDGLIKLYKRVCFAGIGHPLPLVIVDEAHNWKNGPRAKSNGYGGFEDNIAPFTRRLLLLTATPFQLRPQEVLELVRAGEVIAPTAEPGDCEERSRTLRELRESVIGCVLENSAKRSVAFSKSWARLSPKYVDKLAEVWASESLRVARSKLYVLANAEGVVPEGPTQAVIAEAALRIDPNLRDLVREGLWLYTLNQDLSQELGALVIRHRRKTDHRLIRVGGEYRRSVQSTALRMDRHLLHVASGIDVRGEAELPHYLLMRAVSEMKKGRGRASLGTALTGCYSTLLHSDEAKRLEKKLEPGSAGSRYFELLQGLVSETSDPSHPKVLAVTERVLDTWRRGEKTLIFCFRTHTADRLKQILSELVQKEITAKLDELGLGEAGLRRVQNRLTRRDDVLITLLLDRVLWSLCWAARSSDMPLPTLTADELRLRDNEFTELARLALRAKVDLRALAPDRVFIHRATEHILANRLLKEKSLPGPLFRKICGSIASEKWVTHPYGVESVQPEQSIEPDITSDEFGYEQDVTALQERGGISEVYTLREDVSEVQVTGLATYLTERRRAATETSILDTYADGPNFWLGTKPADWLDGDKRAVSALRTMHGHLLRVTRSQTQIDWFERMMAMEACRRMVLARSLLIRMLPASAAREEQGWAEAIVEGFFRASEEQQENLAERLAVFLEDFQAASGPTWDRDKSRAALYDATRARGGPVVLVQGSTDPRTRDRVFVGFNSPLLPDILVCTSVGAEGIDLHRHCRNVVHFDLAWNPAVLEQRTGRVDRIGSKAHRDRQRASSTELAPFLDVGVPFLAGTYDERMFEELRMRAQMFEVLTGGDVSVDNVEGFDNAENAEGSETGVSLPVLPISMIEDLRVKLHVWKPTDGKNGQAT